VLIARYAGLDAITETGYLSGGGHEWNRVKVDNSWCVVDVTNNDRDTYGNALVNISEAQMDGILVPDGTAFYGSYTANDETKEYYYVNDSKASTNDEAVSMIKDQMAQYGYAQIRVSPDLSDDDYNYIFTKLTKEYQLQLTEASELFNILYVK
jgi:hypothetical protein